MHEEEIARRVRAASRRRLAWIGALVAALTVTVGLAAALYYWGVSDGISHTLNRANQTQASTIH